MAHGTVANHSIAVLRCPPHDSWPPHSHHVPGSAHSDLARIFETALVRRLDGSRGTTAEKVGPPDLRFVPSACIPRLGAAGWARWRPRLGTFTADGNIDMLPDRLCCQCNTPMEGKCKKMSCMHRYAPIMDRLAVLTVESPVFIPAWIPPATGVHGYRVPHWFGDSSPKDPVRALQVPYPSSWRAWDGVQMVGVTSLQERMYLAALVVGVQGVYNRGALALRELLVHECASAPTECFLELSARQPTVQYDTTMANRTLVAYRNARFCLQPWGDTSTRKGFADALLLGCINVIFFKEGLATAATDHFVDHRLISVLVPPEVYSGPSGMGVLAFLRAIPPERLQWYHAKIAKLRGRYEFAMHAGSPRGDALQVAIKGVAKHFAAAHSQQQHQRGASVASRHAEGSAASEAHLTPWCSALNVSAALRRVSSRVLAAHAAHLCRTSDHGVCTRAMRAM